jgi:hypothetical protein
VLLGFEELQTEVREDGGFQKLNEFINLDEKVDGDFEFSAGAWVSTQWFGASGLCSYLEEDKLTRSAISSTPAHMLAPINTTRMLQRHCGTSS